MQLQCYVDAVRTVQFCGDSDLLHDVLAKPQVSRRRGWYCEAQLVLEQLQRGNLRTVSTLHSAT